MTALEYIFGLFAEAFGAAFGWFFDVLTASGSAGVYLAVFAMYCIVRFLIAPIIGNSSAKAGDD